MKEWTKEEKQRQIQKRIKLAFDLVKNVVPTKNVLGCFDVKSLTTDDVYMVDLMNESCTCQDWTIYGVFQCIPCKHMIASAIKQKMLGNQKC